MTSYGGAERLEYTCIYMYLTMYLCVCVRSDEIQVLLCIQMYSIAIHVFRQAIHVLEGKDQNTCIYSVFRCIHVYLSRIVEYM